MLALVLVLFLAATVTADLSGAPKGKSVASGGATFTVRPGNISQTVQAAATVVQPATASLTFPAAQSTPVLTGLFVQVGSRVTAGQPLAQEDTAALNQAVAQEKANLDAALANLTGLQAGGSYQHGLTVAHRAYLDAAAQYRQSVQLGLAQAEANLETVRAELQADKQNLSNDENLLAQQENLAGSSNGQPNQFPAVVAAEAKVAADRAAIVQAQATLALDRVQLAQAQDPSALLAQLHAARVKYEQYPSSVAAAQAAVEGAQAQAAAARLGLADATLRAPFAGVISAVNYTAGEVVTPGTPVVTLVPATGSLQIQAEVSEADIVRVRVGQPATFVPDASPGRVYHGVVTAVAASPVISQSVTQYQVTITLKKASPPDALVPGLTGTATVTVAQARGVLYVPATALELGAHPVVYLAVSGGRPVRRPVETGLYNENLVQITGGLRAGDVVLRSAPVGGSAP